MRTTPGDVDLEHGRIAITKQIHRKTGVARSTKTRRARQIEIEAELLPLLVLLVRENGERLLRMPPDEDRAELLREKHLPAAGCKREDLYADDEMRSHMRFHNLRDTWLTWMAVRGDDPLRIQWRGGHTDFETTRRYIAEGRNLARGFGEPFPPLPAALLGVERSTVQKEKDPESFDPRSFPASRSHSRGVRGAIPTGVEPVLPT